jgi:hypothetical protein
MTETNERPYEERYAEVTDWIKTIGETGTVSEMDPDLVKGVIEGMGANPKVSELAKESLARYSNYYKRPGLNAVWGRIRVKAFIRWARKDFIPKYEQKTGRELHTLWDKKTKTYDNIKYSGMLQFLGELTAFAEGQMSKEEYKRLTERRIEKGRKFAYGDPYEPYQPSENAPIPPEFPLEAWNYLRSLKSR